MAINEEYPTPGSAEEQAHLVVDVITEAIKALLDEGGPDFKTAAVKLRRASDYAGTAGDDSPIQP